MAEDLKLRTNLFNRWSALKTERATWLPRWVDISTYLLPKNGRYFVENRDKGYNVWNNIYDNSATQALKTLAAGLMSGATSPARPWFRLQTPDESLNDYQPVKVWLDQVSTLMHKAFNESNTYRSLHQMYMEMGAFGTGCAIILPDFNEVIRHHTLTTGEYCIATDANGDVCTLYRNFQMQVSAMVKEFGLEKCSQGVQAMYKSGNLDAWVTIYHAIEPRADRDLSKRDPKNMAWASYHFEEGGSANGKYLRESGYKSFPVVAPRWDVVGGDIYGSGPGMEALGDIKQLQFQQLRKTQAIEYQVNPPLAVPTSMKNREVDRTPGGITFIDPTAQNNGVKSLYEVNLQLNYLLQDMQDVRGRIDRTFFKDLFLMISNMTDPKMTATEVAARQEEKMLMLGPVLERLSNELLNPMIDITFETLVQGNALPPPPQEMQGMPLSVELVSVLAQAQRAIGTNSMDRFVSNLGVIAQMKPDVLDKFDSDEWADKYSDALGIPPTLIIASDKVALIRQQRAKAQAAQQQAAATEQMSNAVKNLGQTPTGAAPNAAGDVLGAFSGYGSTVQ